MSLIQERQRAPSTPNDWSRWAPSAPYSVGVEEEVMVLNADGWHLASGTDEFLAGLPEELAASVAGDLIAVIS